MVKEKERGTKKKKAKNKKNDPKQETNKLLL